MATAHARPSRISPCVWVQFVCVHTVKRGVVAGALQREKENLLPSSFSAFGRERRGDGRTRLKE